VSLNKRFRTNKEIEEAGIRVEYKDGDEVYAWIKCRRPGGRNSLFQKTLSKKLRENRQALEQDDDGSVDNRLLAETYAEAVVVDWGGEIEGPDGEVPAACTKENIVWLLTEEAPDLFRDLQVRLQSRSNWQDKAGDAKNSESASSTSSAGGRKKKDS